MGLIYVGIHDSNLLSLSENNHQWISPRNQMIVSAGEAMEEKEPFYIFGGNVN